MMIAGLPTISLEIVTIKKHHSIRNETHGFSFQYNGLLWI